MKQHAQGEKFARSAPQHLSAPPKGVSGLPNALSIVPNGLYAPPNAFSAPPTGLYAVPNAVYVLPKHLSAPSKPFYARGAALGNGARLISPAAPFALPLWFSYKAGLKENEWHWII
ncbi:hypothetical protein GCM10023186_34020 [Hymenobacter koreensis]|uniref:Uncharacterized protein n=1 Tax=Hymenobacter koreensis TaxID=1084523 RepID=A0ABP8JBG2_9BACT